jgi:hypothetical protein
LSVKRFFTPFKIGLLIVTVAYFLFTLHGVLTLEWIGEWDRIGGGGFRFAIYIEDITAYICLVFRLAASIIALASVIYYFVKKGITNKLAYTLLRVVVVFEAIYWLGLATTAYYSLESFTRILLSASADRILNSLALSVIPDVVEAIILPIALFILALKLSPNKPEKSIIKWALISGIFYVLSFWLVYSSIWAGIIRQKGIEYVTSRPESALSFGLTVFGLAALAIYMIYFTWKSRGVSSIGQLQIKKVGAIVLALGLYFLWNYISWVIFAGDQWNSWYAMFLGHNMDLWMLSLPLVALPMLVSSKGKKDRLAFAIEGVGAVFIGVFLAAYLAGIPTLAVYHSDPIVRAVLAIVGAIFLVLILAQIVIAVAQRKHHN